MSLNELKSHLPLHEEGVNAVIQRFFLLEIWFSNLIYFGNEVSSHYHLRF